MSARGVVWFDELEAEYWRQGAGLKIVGGHVEHHWFLDDFKTESGWAEANCARLVVAGYTPFQRTFTISAVG